MPAVIFSYLSHSCHIVVHLYRLTHAYGNIQTSNNKSSLPSLLSFLTRKSGSCGQTPPCSRQWYGPLLDDHGVHSPPPRLPLQRTRKPPFPMSHLMREKETTSLLKPMEASMSWCLMCEHILKVIIS